MSDRHPKWTPVEPGHLIPAGQPWRREFDDGSASENPNKRGAVANDQFDSHANYFIDSSWKPTLVLPTEPTWGIAAIQNSGNTHRVGQFVVNAHDSFSRSNDGLAFGYVCHKDEVLDFIPLTEEQVARIEAAR